MKKTLLSFILALLVAAPLASIAPGIAQAATINTAIRGTSTDTVYWYANDGKRYVFPNSTTYFSWFPNFNNVQTVSDSELYAIAIGGNVTMRPGANLIKVTTDPKVYAVSRGGVLRWVTSEYLASQLFGSNWNTKVVDVADSYFTNYTVGSAIYNVSDFNVSNEYSGVSTPNDSLRGMTGSTGTNGASGSVLVDVSRTSINPGDAVTVTIRNPNNFSGSNRIEIYDTRANNLVRTCYLPTSTCDVTVYPQRNSTETSVQYYAAVRDTNSGTIQNGYSPVIYFGNVNGSGSLSNTGSRFTTTISRSSVNSGDQVTLTANLFSNYGLTSSYRIDIQDPRTGTTLQTCWNSQYCSASTSVYATNGSNVVFQARLLDQNGNVIATDVFPTVYIGTNGSNGSAFSSGSSRLDADRTSVNAGSQVVLTATATNLTTDVSNIRMELYRDTSNVLLDTCYDKSVCSFTQTLNGDTSTNGVRFYVLVKNDAGDQIPAAYSPLITVNGNSQNNGNLTLWVDRTSINSGDTVNVSAWAGSSFNASRIEIYDERNNTLVFTCYTVSSCNQSRQIYRNGSESSVRLYAYLKDWNGATLATAWSSYITFNGTSNGNNNSQLTLSSDRTTVSVDQQYVNLTADTHLGRDAYGQVAVDSIEIRDARTNYLLVTCKPLVVTCTSRVSAFQWNQSSVQYLAVSKDYNGNTLQTALSPIITIVGASNNNGCTYNCGSSNDSVNYINGLVLNADRTSISAGQTVHLTANAYNAGTWSYSGNRIEIRDVNSGQIVKTCYDQNWCMIDVYPVAQSSSILTAQYQARIYDRNGNLAMSQYSPVIYLSSYNGSNGNTNGSSNLNGSGVTSIAPSSNMRVNNSVYITGTFTGMDNLAMGDAMIQIFTEQSSTPIATCNGAYTCSVSFATGSYPINTRTYARISDRNNSNRWLETNRTSLVTTY